MRKDSQRLLHRVTMEMNKGLVVRDHLWQQILQTPTVETPV